MEKKIRILKVIFLAGIFLAIFIFFAQIHPLVIFDTDDWNYISCKRHPIPLWGNWNPTRVFPEVLMPLCGDIAGFLVYPLTGDYIRSFTFVNGAVIALFFVLYMNMFFELLSKKWKLPAFRVFAFSTVFLLLHFWVFRTKDAGNEYLFLSRDVTCYYYYEIPALLNCSLVLYLMRNDVLYDGWRKLKTGTFTHHIVRNSILFLALYFALFSNLYQSAILAAFVGGQLLLELISLIKDKSAFKEFIEKNVFRLMFIAAWAVEQIFEVNGGRANGFVGSMTIDSLLQSIISTTKSMSNKVASMNKLFLFGSTAVFFSTIIIGIYHYLKKSPKEKNSVGGVHRPACILLISDLLIIVYLLLLCSCLGTIGRSDIWFSILFFVFLALMLCSSYLLSKIRFLDLFLPLVCCFLVFETRTSSRTFSDFKMGGVDNSTCVAIDNDIISQFVETDKNGESEMILYVPVFKASSNDNFPLAAYGGPFISRALYRHGVINRPITVTEMVPTREKNEQFKLAN